ncbi:MAG: hypothetical protein ACP5E3_03160 [Bacteroidales bacterium]
MPKGKSKVGRPRSEAKMLIEMLEKELKKKHEDKTYAQMLVESIVKKAAIEGDEKSQKFVYETLYGKPKESPVNPQVNIFNLIPREADKVKLEEFKEPAIEVEADEEEADTGNVLPDM